MLNLKKLLTRILTFLPHYYGAYVKNLNTLTKLGFGYTNSATGAPATSNGFFAVFPVDLNATVVLQLYIPYNTARIYTRMYASGAWLSWIQN